MQAYSKMNHSTTKNELTRTSTVSACIASLDYYLQHVRLTTYCDKLIINIYTACPTRAMRDDAGKAISQ